MIHVNWKRGLALVLAGVMVASLAGCNSQTEGTTAAATEAATAVESQGEAVYTPGTYTGTSRGYAGDVTVTVTVDETSITAVTSEGPDETASLGGAALPVLDEEVLAAQSAEIDIVSGASMTSNGYIAALEQALAEARGE